MSNLFWPSSPAKIPVYWAAEWSRVARPYEEAGKAHEQAGRINQAREAYIQAYTYYAAARYPVPHSSGKMQSFRKSLELYENAGRYFDPPLKRIEICYGDKIIPAYLRLRRDGKSIRSSSMSVALTALRPRLSNTKRPCTAAGLAPAH